MKKQNLLEKVQQLENENKRLKQQLNYEFDEELLQYSNLLEDMTASFKEIKNIILANNLTEKEKQLILQEINKYTLHN